MNESEIIKAYKAIAVKKRNEKRKIRIENIQKISQNNKELNLEKTYPIILADPPWFYTFGNEERNIQINYPTMKLEDICNLKVPQLAQKNALLFLWATSPKLHEAMQVISAWDFDYKTCAVWVKNRPITGYYFRQQHELLLIATRGSGIPTPEVQNRPVSIIPGLVRAHSQKPDELYLIIEKMYPELEKIELFARSKKKIGTLGEMKSNEIYNLTKEPLLKTAILISNHMRSYEQCFSTFKRAIIDPLLTIGEVDIFIHTWDTLGFDGERVSGEQTVSPINLQRINDLYQPKAIKVETRNLNTIERGLGQKPWDLEKYKKRTVPELRDVSIPIFMFYSIAQAYKLMEENKQEYFKVIRVRPDLYFENDLDLKEFTNNFQYTFYPSQAIHLPKFGDYRGYNDSFAYGGWSHMSSYCNIYYSLDFLFDQGCVWNAEALLKQQLINRNYNGIMRSNIDYVLFRSEK